MQDTSISKIELPALQLEPGDRIAFSYPSLVITLLLFTGFPPLLPLHRNPFLREEARVQPRAVPRHALCRSCMLPVWLRHWEGWENKEQKNRKQITENKNSFFKKVFTMTTFEFCPYCLMEIPIGAKRCGYCDLALTSKRLAGH